MSLVNYGSSDESSGNEEDSSHVENVSRRSRPRPIPARDSEVHVEHGTSPPTANPWSILIDTSSGLGLDMVVGPVARNETRTVVGGDPTRKRSLLSGLPPPKSSKPRKGLELSENKNDPGTKNVTEVDSSTNIKRSFLNLPPPKKKSQTVKITLPTLPDPGSDEDDEPVAKKPAPSKGVSGLLSMLPKPKSAMSSRILVPHTVSRKPPPQKLKPQIKPSPKTNSTSVASAISVDYGSDDNDDDEGSSFFSLGASSLLPEVSSSNKCNEKLGSKTSLPSLPPTTSNKNYLSADSSNVKKLPKPTVNVSNNVNILPQSSTSSSSSSFVCSKEPPTNIISSSISTRTYDASTARTSGTDENSYNALSPMANVEPDSNSSSITNIADAPLSFNKSHSSTNSGYGHVTSSYYTNYDYSGNYYQAGQSAYEYNQPFQDTRGYQEYADSTEVGGMQQEVLEDVNDDDEQLRRFLGKNRNKDDINMISINADDQTAGSNSREALLKSISEEKQPMTYSKKKNSDLPSSQQRRKHQITYLAFQAKERELALKNQWSQNRMTRKQTQAKYGF
ncbi:proline-rich protein PRCC-like [Anneissia japonica]|uniref:proline-rich protein PRCC-like n=1 Tax=Anneissia japonica TaxID=1529436 RepID=UPI001425BB39|nr:proline-rich protein PRCC-like [Anneissia japonica]